MNYVFNKKIRNKFLQRFLVLALTALLILPLSVFVLKPRAVSPMEYTVSKVSGKAGDTVEVSVNISPNSEVGAMSFDLSYDKSKLKYEKNEYNTTTGAMITVNPDYKAGFRLVLIHAGGLSFGGPLLTVEFKILPGWSGKTDLKLSVEENYHYKSYDEVPFTVKNGSVSVSGGTGDTTTTQRPTTTKPTTTKPTTTKPTTTKPTTTKPAATKPTSPETVTTKGEKASQKDSQAFEWVTVPDSILDKIFPDKAKPKPTDSPETHTQADKNIKTTIDKDEEGKGKPLLNEEEKQELIEYLEKESIPVSIADDGSIYIQEEGEGTEPESTTEPSGDSSLVGDESDADSNEPGRSTQGYKLAAVFAAISVLASLIAVSILLKKRKSA
ncbi:MAG: hypothetical protein GX345_07685 [Clostridiales bacterium]|nr:hypothetical protein [Clostridiales bacterium]